MRSDSNLLVPLSCQYWTNSVPIQVHFIPYSDACMQDYYDTNFLQKDIFNSWYYFLYNTAKAAFCAGAERAICRALQCAGNSSSRSICPQRLFRLLGQQAQQQQQQAASIGESDVTWRLLLHFDYNSPTKTDSRFE